MVMLGNGNGTFLSPVSSSTPCSFAYPKFAIGGLNGDHKSPRAAGQTWCLDPPWGPCRSENSVCYSEIIRMMIEQESAAQV